MKIGNNNFAPGEGLYFVADVGANHDGDIDNDR